MGDSSYSFNHSFNGFDEDIEDFDKEDEPSYINLFNEGDQVYVAIIKDRWRLENKTIKKVLRYGDWTFFYEFEDGEIENECLVHAQEKKGLDHVEYLNLLEDIVKDSNLYEGEEDENTM